MKNFFLVLFFAMQIIWSMSQFGLNGGISVLKPFGELNPFVGIHLGAEVPRDDQVSIFGKIAFYGSQEEATENTTFAEPINPAITFDYPTVRYTNSINYTIIEGGNRYYIGDGYDSGFGAYGGGTVALIFNTIKRNYSDYDQSKYKLNSNEFPKGNIFNLGFGLCGGIKHTLAGVGTFYLDANFSYLIFSYGSNATATGHNMYSPLLFSFNIGYRKDFY